jgi:hypothetical protein
VIVSDCCACRAEPKGAQVASCLATCAVDACAANQIEAHEVTCAFDRCVLARSCDWPRQELVINNSLKAHVVPVRLAGAGHGLAVMGTFGGL